MDRFIIPPSKKQFARVFDNTFLWNEGNVYIMANHRLALWCWLQCNNIYDRKHALIHIDEHTDARRWEGPGEPECLEKALSCFDDLKDFKVYEGLQCPYRDPWQKRSTRPCVTYDNFVHLAAKAKIFNHYYMYSSVGDWHTGLSEATYDLNKKVQAVSSLSENIKKYAGKCIVDIDLDFFDSDSGAIFPKGLTEEKLLIQVFETVAKHRDKISMITISLNESPGDSLWDKRQSQLSIVKEILGIDVSIPIVAESDFV